VAREGKGPTFHQGRRLVRYRRSDVDAWLRACTIGEVAA